MYELIFEPAFRSDYRRIKRAWPAVAYELRGALELLRVSGVLPAEYGAHELSNFGGNYNGCIDFHLSDGVVDVIVLYVPHKSNPSICFVRMGTHEGLFRGPDKGCGPRLGELARVAQADRSERIGEGTPSRWTGRCVIGEAATSRKAYHGTLPLYLAPC